MRKLHIFSVSLWKSKKSELGLPCLPWWQHPYHPIWRWPVSSTTWPSTNLSGRFIFSPTLNSNLRLLVIPSFSLVVRVIDSWLIGELWISVPSRQILQGFDQLRLKGIKTRRGWCRHELYSNPWWCLCTPECRVWCRGELQQRLQERSQIWQVMFLVIGILLQGFTLTWDKWREKQEVDDKLASNSIMSFSPISTEAFIPDGFLENTGVIW